MKKLISILLFVFTLMISTHYYHVNSYEFTNENGDGQVSIDNEHEQEPGQFPDNQRKDNLMR